MGGDPSPGIVKSFSILIRQYTFGSSFESSHAKALYCSEGGQISLDTTDIFDPAQSDADTQARLSAQAVASGDRLLAIDEATYGGKDVKPLIIAACSRYRAGGGKLPWSFGVDNVSMGGDPQPGVVKIATVVFRTFKAGNVVGTSVHGRATASEGTILVFS